MANKITTVLDLDDRGFRKSISSIRTEIANAEGATGKFKAAWGGAMDSLRANAGVAAAAVGVAMFKVGKDAVAAASELEQSTGGVEKAFGETAEAVLQIGLNADETMGLSKRAFNEGALALSAFAEDIARDTGQPVAEVIQDLMTRAADFAAAYGTSVPDAVRIFSSTLSGESEPIKKFGIIVNETETKAYAAEKGIDELGKTTQRAGLLMDETAKFAGQFGDESETLAGRSERLKAKIENLQAELGEELLPAVSEVAGGVGNLIGLWKTLSESPPVKLLIEVSGNDSALGLINEIGQFAAGVPGTQMAFGMVKDAIDDAGSATLITTGHIGDLTGVTDEVKEATENAAGALEWERQALSYAGKAAEEARRDTEALEQAFVDLREELSDDSAYLDVQDAFDDVKRAGEEAWNAAATGADDAEVKARDYQRAQIETKQNVLDYIEVLGDVPLETTSKFMALIDEGAFAEVERRLATLEKIRIARVTPETYVPQAPTGSGGVRYGATGGIVTQPTLAVIGEAGPEAVLPLDGAPGASPLPAGGLGGSGGPTVFNVTINADPNPDVTVRKLREFVRRNGPIQGIT